MERLFEVENTLLDPLAALESRNSVYSDMNDFYSLPSASWQTGQSQDHAQVDSEHMSLPELIDMPVTEPCPVEPERLMDDFWKEFGDALGISLDHLELSGREALAINTARLFRQCIGGLRKNLHTRSELKRELQLVPDSISPLEDAADVSIAMDKLLLGTSPSLVQAFRDLQAHQVAMFDAGRTLVRATFDHFSPQHLTWQFELDNGASLLRTAGSRWRAYMRHYRTLEQESEWEEHLLVRNFSQAYQEQIRLINTLHFNTQG
ncbi:hypothetical protein PSCICO_00510 [Pseudomonas cichorii]|uniref:type VI secretion system-associated FHA domain protein TagH n=1 Tax=Pseudomonas cichorii TaxID=36746 RepID=UPI00190FD37A|nr:type VI secretion system-associated FHA domain protein TagH [Pseudomonas cichorii]GFM84652.1 hypothetical protein PSCICO_00510 [Pseudomonas cichorii]